MLYFNNNFSSFIDSPQLLIILGLTKGGMSIQQLLLNGKIKCASRLDKLSGQEIVTSFFYSVDDPGCQTKHTVTMGTPKYNIYKMLVSNSPSPSLSQSAEIIWLKSNPTLSRYK